MTQPPLALPPVSEPFRLPFHYGALHNVGIDLLVDPEPVHKVLSRAHPALVAADFDGQACVSVNFQLYFAQYPQGASLTQEIEVNVIAFPRGQEDRLAPLSYAEYAQGVDQTRLLGIGRIVVLCDNPFAIDAGVALYAEPKHSATFQAVMPSLNGEESALWSVTARGPAEDEPELLTLTADLTGLPSVTATNTPITGYGTTPAGDLLAGPMNVYQPYRLHLLDESTRDRVTIQVSESPSGFGDDLRTLIGDGPAAGVWTYQSAPVAAHQRPYFVPASARHPD